MISIIIPCYNAAPYIGETLESIFAQEDAGPIEVIVVDDGSTDESAAVIKEKKEDRLFYIHQRNAGVSVARNKGLGIAKGSYVIFFDADDKMTPGFLRKRKQALENSNAGFASGPVLTFPIESEETYGIPDNPAFHLLTYSPSYNSCPSNYLIRRSVLTEHHIQFNEELSSTADRYFLIELGNKAVGILIKDAPLMYRITPNSMSNKLTTKLILDNEKYFFALQENDLIPEQIRSEFNFKIKYILGLGFIRTGVFNKGLRYTVLAFAKHPFKFIKQLLK